eukprot:7389941-Prymnesium_polylepis.1
MGAARRASARLNAKQRVVLETAVANRLTLVQGPPGTGKTHVSVAIIGAWVAGRAHGGAPVLATSDSNIAVDNLLMGLRAAGVAAIRLGRPEAVHPDLLQYCVDQPQPQEEEEEEEEGEGKEREGGSRGAGRRLLDPAAAKAARVEAYEAKMAMLKSAEVVCATCIGIGSELLARVPFRAVLMDEATQATEASTLVGLCRSAQQVVLVGDQCQLPPTVRTAAGGTPEARPLFNRLLDDGLTTSLLATQYRMHPALAQLPSDLFYAGGLDDGVEAAERPPPRGFDWPRRDMPIALVPVYDGREEAEGTSRANAVEAHAAVDAVVSLLAAGELGASEVGVITPYAAQARRIRALLREAAAAGDGIPGAASVEVSSVDGFQGREKECIIFSAVRANQRGRLGFLADARRANVALTRARRGLIVLGHPSTLAKDDDGVWGHWMGWARAHGLVVGEEARGEYDAERARWQVHPDMPGSKLADMLG